ncbi:MAG: T9SS type A sorting domain-containing protein [Bacteroidota bacterium]
MHQMTTRTLSLLILSLCFSFFANAQMIWPGDINNNGIVNGVDFLYWGVANQATGPNRPDGNTIWQEQAMGNPWTKQFPQSTNYAYADANGNGQVDANDADALSQNFGLVHGTQVPDNFQPELPIDVVAPGMLFNQFEDEVVSGQAAEVLFLLGDNMPFESFYGLTFTLNYHPGILQAEDGLLVSLYSESFFNPTNTGVAAFVQNNSAAGTATVTFVRTDQTDVQGAGKVARFILNFADLTLPGTPDQLPFSVTDIMAIDSEMNPVGIASAGMLFTNNGGITGGCPNTVSPVCGSNGVTYLNSCYAEAAGIYDYTPGTCFDDSCIDPWQINPTQNCPTDYEPVCGCNNITYPNECAADAAGVQSTRPGPCPPSSCYDPQYVITSNATTVNDDTGVITATCPADDAPVCGCNAVTYDNACYAEAAGITVYTPGTCESACIDANQIDPDALCPLNYDPVCGCNGVTYPNDCRADAAGVTSYTSGPCSGTSAWCAEAVPIQCGDFLPFETTVGAGNNITNYPGCTNTSFYGPDRVYVIEKQSAGDLQIGLEIITPGMDLDLFLLADNCSQLTCLAKSTTSNTNTNNEGIILEDAPIGTYYIVVDGQYPSSEGTFRLEVSCGYLYCGDAVSLQCGEPYWGTNLNGNDDVSLYGCGNVRNVENNGPEIVHTFTTTEDGPVTITLAGLSANLELFLLNSCDRGDCLEYSQNSGTQNEYISEFLPAGTYYVVVDGYNGAVSDYDLLVECSTQCDFTLVDLSATSSSCGQNTGSIHIGSSGGTPNYLVTYSGPVSGSFTTSSNSCTIYYLPPGTYTITKTDSQGCSVTGTVTILGGGNLSATLTPNDAVCMSEGSIDVHIANGQAPYHIYVSGPTSGNLVSQSNNFTISNLDPGDYSIHITDANGCSISQQVTINHSSGNFTWSFTVTPASCGDYGAIHVQTYNGDSPYNILVSGPVSGGATVHASSFNIINLPGGTYQVTIEDDNWCQVTRTVVIPDGNLEMSATPHPGVCGDNGSIEVNVSNGDAPYWITWTGPQSGSISTNSSNYTIPNLPAGSYTITVEDDNGCTDSETVTLTVGEGGGLSINVIPLPGSCTQNGALWIDIFSGTPSYTISYTGPESGILSTNEDGLDIGNLPCGTYTVIITDANGCSGTQTVEIGGCDEIDVDLTPQNGICGLPGSVLVTINGGSPTYVVSWTGPQNGQTTTATNVVNLPNLPAGTYSVQVTDANGCSDYAVTQVTSAESNLHISTTVSEAVCGSGGSIGVNLSGGVGPYQVSWTGPESGSQTISGSSTIIGGLIAGVYTIYAVDANGCSATTTEEILNVGSDLEVSLVGNNGICNDFGNIGVYIANGTAPYLISWSGPQTGSASTNGTVFQIPNTPAGNYTVVVTDANGCSTSGTVSVSVENNLLATLQPVDGLCGSTGAIIVDIQQGAPNFTISWTGPQSGSVSINGFQYAISNLPSGTYTVVITDNIGCTRTLTAEVDNSNGGLDITTALIYNVCGQYNTIWVDIVGGTPPYTVSWEGPQTSSGTTNTQGFEIMDLPPGTYKVTVVDVNGCMDMEQDIIIFPSPVDIFDATPSGGVCGETGSIQVNIDGGTAPYVLNWNGPVSGTQTYNTGGVYVLDNLPGGTYTLTLTDDNGCTETETVVINTGSPVQVITALIYNECGQYNTIWVDIVGGTPPYTVTWEGGQDGSATTSTQGYEIEDLPPGTYKVTVIDANGCMDMQQDIIIFPAPINIFTATPIAGTCAGPGSIVVTTIEGTAPYSLSWSGPQNGSDVFSGSSYTIGSLPAGTYTLTLIDDNGCAENEVVTVTTAEDDVDLSATPNNGDCTTEGSITAQAAGGDGTYTLTWTGPESGSATIGGTPFQIGGLSPGTYVLTVDDGNGCDDTESVILTDPEDDLLISLTPTPGDCEYDGQIAVSIAGANPNYTVTWTGPESGTVTIGGQFVVLPDLDAGTYTVSVVSADGCSSTASTVLTAPEGALTIAATPIAGFCGEQGYIFLNIIGGVAPWQVSWAGPESGSLTTNSPNVQIPDLLPGGYTITVVSGNCDGAVSSLLPAPAPDLEVTAIPSPAVCGEGGSIYVSVANGQGTTTISWTGPESGSQTINGSNLTIPNLTNGTYTITATSGSCSDVTLATVQNTNSNIVVSASPNPAVCDQNGSIYLSYSGGQAPYTIAWTGPSNGTFTTNGTSYTIPNLTAGTYNITVSNGNCTGSATATVTQQNNDLGIWADPQDGNCLTPPGFSITFSGGTPPYLLTWQGPENGSATVNGNSYDLNDVATGLYSFTVTDQNGCTISTIESVGDTSIDIDLTATDGTCGDNGSIMVSISNGTGPYQISWYGEVEGFATSNSPVYVIENLPGSPYTVVVQDVNGCITSDNIVVESGPTDFEVVHSVSNNGCGSLNNIWMDFFNGVGPYTIEWIGPNSGTATTNNPYYDIENAASGVYIIIVTDGTGCVDVQWVEVINIQNTLDVTFEAINGSCGGPASIAVHIDGGTPWYTIAWNLGATPVGEVDVNSSFYTIDDLEAGTYYVRVTDANGCQRSANVTVQTPADLLQVNPTIVGPGCNTLGSIGLLFDGGEAPYSIDWSGDASGSASTNTNSYIITGLNGGHYFVTVMDANGCQNALSLTVPGTTPGNLVADFDYTIDGLTVNFQNLSSNGIYFWEFGDGNEDGVTNPQHSYAAPGTYTVCLEVWGSCGSDTHCETITVTAEENLALLDIGESEGGPNATVQVPVTIDNVQNIISLAGSIEVMNEEVALITGVTNGIIAPQYNVANNTFSYFNNSGDHLDVGPDDVLFYLNVLLLGDAGESTIIKFVQTPLPIEVGAVIGGTPTVVPYTLSMGSASIVNMAALSGNLSTFWGEGIMDAAVTITGPGVEETMMTNEGGTYNMPDLTPGMEYTVSVEKNAAADNGLSTYGLFIGQRFLLGMNPPQVTSPYQVIAGDANCNDAFTTLDLFLIQRLIIGAQSDFDQCPSWVFVTEGQDMPTDFDAYNVFPYESTSSMMLMEPETANFVGVKVGDILGEANPANFGGEGEGRNLDPLPFVADNPTVAAGDEVTLYFRSEDFADMVSYQFGIQFPTSQLEFLEFLPSEEQPFHTVVVGGSEAANGELRLSWFSLDGNGHSATPSTTLFALKFRAQADITDWNSLLRIDPNGMLPEAYNSTDDAFEPELQFGETITSTDDPTAANFRLDQNNPNPFGGVTNIGFYLPEGSMTTFSIHDAYGQLIWQQEKHYGAGEQRLRLDQLALPAGVYYYTLRAGEQTATRSMVVVRP